MSSSRALATAFISALLGLLAPPALAGPRVGVVVASHEGLSEEHSDEIAYDVAAAVATQIEGEAIAGSSVRELLPSGIPDGCEDQAACGRNLAATLKTDEVLLVAMHSAGKTTVVDCHRVPRDAAKEPAEKTLRLLGGKAKRADAVMEVVSALYPQGSVTPFIEPAPTVKPSAAIVAPEVVAPPEAKARPEEKEGSHKWLWLGVGVGAGVVAIVAVILGLTLGLTRAPTGPSVTLP